MRSVVDENALKLDGVRFEFHCAQDVPKIDMIGSCDPYFIERIDYFLDPTEKQKWSPSYKAAQTIFEGPMSFGVQSLINHDFWKLLCDETTLQIKPCVYTYIIDDLAWRFSETGASFFLDFASKHALHANCSETVRYAGEFHPRPICGWDRFTSASELDFDQWELVINNGSSTYAPNRSCLV
ncbi:unnamed protein product [Rotaria magnacalcarata]|uniref:Uncharacterized protein n=2 Tax=Rotaria magnacalcarata TaxID=392030 RepID=A0A8S2QUF4_9BILA|nr:unnamed protein product [Rotaria magnacalcarata]